MRPIRPLLFLVCLAPPGVGCVQTVPWTPSEPSASSNAAGDAAGDAEGPNCTGIVADPSAVPSREQPADPVQPGAAAPSYALLDFQPRSCSYGKAYGLDQFQGRVTFLALFASW